VTDGNPIFPRRGSSLFFDGNPNIPTGVIITFSCGYCTRGDHIDFGVLCIETAIVIILSIASNRQPIICAVGTESLTDTNLISGDIQLVLWACRPDADLAPLTRPSTVIVAPDGEKRLIALSELEHIAGT